MSELTPRHNTTPQETESLQPELDKGKILDALFHLKDRYELDLEEEDLENLLGKDDNDFLGNLATFALMHGIDYEDFFIELGIPAIFIIDVSNDLEITDGKE